MTKVEIANMALGELDQEPIADFDQENDRARKIKRFYDPSRRAALRAHLWNFADARQNLTRISLQDEAGAEIKYSGQYPYVFNYPNDCLFVRGIYRKESPEFVGTAAIGYGGHALTPKSAPHKVVYLREQKIKAIVCALKEPALNYTADITDPNIFDDLFCEALSLLMASRMALDAKTSQFMLQKYAMRLSEAEEAARNEAREEFRFVPSSVRAR
jgi:hypothetical protein